MIIYMGQSNRRYRMVGFFIPEKERRRKRKKIFEEMNIFFCRGVVLNRRKIIGEDKCTFAEENEKEENIWREEIYFGGEKRE